jgi:hypothetical protein
METFYEDNTPLGLRITPPAAAYLREAARWGKFLAIVGFVVIGFVGLMAIFAGAFMGAMMDGAEGGVGFFSSGFLTVFYLLIALLYFFPVLYLYRFASKVQQGLNLQSEAEVNEAFKNLKSLLKFIGVLTIVMLAFNALGILAMLLGVGIGSLM